MLCVERQQQQFCFIIREETKETNHSRFYLKKRAFENGVTNEPHPISQANTGSAMQIGPFTASRCRIELEKET